MKKKIVKAVGILGLVALAAGSASAWVNETGFISYETAFNPLSAGSKDAIIWIKYPDSNGWYYTVSFADTNFTTHGTCTYCDNGVPLCSGWVDTAIAYQSTNWYALSGGCEFWNEDWDSGNGYVSSIWGSPN